jgi:hypothetical protein
MARHERMLWAALVVLVVSVQWPALKGFYYDRDSTVAGRYGVHGIPTILVLDAQGQVIRRGSFLSASGMVHFLTRTD